MPKPIILIDARVIIGEKNGAPVVELRKVTGNPEAMKLIIDATIRGRAISILPVFSDRLRSLNSLIEKGIITIDVNEGGYVYNIGE